MDGRESPNPLHERGKVSLGIGSHIDSIWPCKRQVHKFSSADLIPGLLVRTSMQLTYILHFRRGVDR